MFIKNLFKDYTFYTVLNENIFNLDIMESAMNFKPIRPVNRELYKQHFIKMPLVICNIKDLFVSKEHISNLYLRKPARYVFICKRQYRVKSDIMLCN